ncbi:MAG: GntR family transcriptional regulator [Actinobacteria bacterium]|nr:GntR family transcriptional regulator [Actinomycetota bacterium]
MSTSIAENSDSAVIRARDQVIALLAILQVGERLPGERELSKQIGVARMTLRRAIESLISDGLLERRPGSGTYARRPIVAAEFRLASFSEEMKRRGLVPGSRVVSFRKSKANQQIARKLRILPEEEIFICVRLRLADGQSIALETLVIPVKLAPDLIESDFEGSLYQALQRKHGIRVTEANSGISAITPTKANAALLNIDQSKPCLQVDMIDKDQHGRILMSAKCIYRGDRYELQLDATAKNMTPNEKGQQTRKSREVS